MSVDWVEDATRAGSELRELTRQAHEAARDLKRARQEALDAIQAAMDVLTVTVEERLGDYVSAGLDAYKTALQTAIENAEASVTKRFDTVANILLGKEDDLDFEELALRIAEVRRPGKPGRAKR